MMIIAENFLMYGNLNITKLYELHNKIDNLIDKSLCAKMKVNWDNGIWGVSINANTR